MVCACRCVRDDVWQTFGSEHRQLTQCDNECVSCQLIRHCALRMSGFHCLVLPCAAVHPGVLRDRREAEAESRRYLRDSERTSRRALSIAGAACWLPPACRQCCVTMTDFRTRSVELPSSPTLVQCRISSPSARAGLQRDQPHVGVGVPHGCALRAASAVIRRLLGVRPHR